MKGASTAACGLGHHGSCFKDWCSCDCHQRPYDQDAELEADRQRFYRGTAILASRILALALVGPAIYFLVTGYFAGLLVTAFAVTLWLIAWGLEQGAWR